MRQFPPGFIWGCATAAYQIEGAVEEDGRKPSIWDTFAHTRGRIEDGHTGDVACDHYHRYLEDVELMQALGLGGYRFSVGWSRVMPEGTGRPNNLGLDFYDRLVDALLDHDITPALTLNHWDMPQALEDRGGWANRDTIDAFVEYAAAVADRLGDRVPLWMTHNEPWVVAFHGYGSGGMAPGRNDWQAATQSAHHLLVAHGMAVKALRERTTQKIGIAPNITPHRPATNTPEDLLAAQRANESIADWFLDPIFLGRYPQLLWERFATHDCIPAIRDGDMTTISEPIDFVGVNYYATFLAKDDPKENGPIGYRGITPELETTDCGWPIDPDGLPATLVELTRKYQPRELYITENGASFDDPTPTNASILDPNRTDYLRKHFAAAHDAIAAGVPLRGYFVWTLLDNFEWIWGYNRRFGVVHVDRESQQRTLKDSARYLQRVASANTLPEQ